MTRLLLLLILLPSLCFAGNFRLEWKAGAVPPAHEPVVGNKVARYMVEVAPGIEFKHFRTDLVLRSWGVQKWRTPGTRGSGWEKYEDSDWGVETWRTGMTVKTEIGPDAVHLFSEYYYPLDRKSWGGHGLERHYYWIIGIGGRL